MWDRLRLTERLSIPGQNRENGQDSDSAETGPSPSSLLDKIGVRFRAAASNGIPPPRTMTWIGATVQIGPFGLWGATETCMCPPSMRSSHGQNKHESKAEKLTMNRTKGTNRSTGV